MCTELFVPKIGAPLEKVSICEDALLIPYSFPHFGPHLMARKGI